MLRDARILTPVLLVLLPLAALAPGSAPPPRTVEDAPDATAAAPRTTPARATPARTTPAQAAPAQDTPAADRPRVLLTNDNGIDDPKLIALARAFAPRAETWVVAPADDQSGSGAFVKLPRTGAVAVERRDLGDGIEAFAVDGHPGDCVLVALLALLRESPPTLVVSGINGGPNLGAGWMFSGTIGAARVAALAGLPAVAVSGLDDDVPGAVDAAVEWVVRFTEHRAVRELEPGQYLTVTLPPGGPTEVQGVRVADRAPLHEGPDLTYDEASGVCRITGTLEREVALSEIADERLHAEGAIVVVPMRAGEVDGARLLEWLRRDPGFPGWRPSGPGR
jgi:5'/3'-nucleotidase SurE